ncbi:MAG TPA: hypothetical protein VKF63_11945 [Terracidiphilus sp.]|nr:hypothetical protein [Terracidiphilus sp.]
MDLLDRYLQAVKKHLPWQRQDDIIAELRANLEAQLEDKEAGLGRPLTTGEAEDWLRQIGPPRQVAARYQPQQYLIGPVLFPTYWFVLRTAVFWVTIAYAVGVAVQIAVRTPSWAAVLEGVLRVPEVLLTTAASVTLIFAVIEYMSTRYPGRWPALAAFPGDWTPSALPPAEKEAVRGEKPRSRAHAIAAVIMIFLCLVWLLLLPHHPYVLLGPGVAYLSASPFQGAPVWWQAYWCVVAITLFQLIWRCIAIYRGRWQQQLSAERMAIAALGLIPLGLLLSIGDHAYITLRHPALDQLRYGGALDSINKSIHLSLLLLCAINVLQLLWGLGRMSLDCYRKHAAAMR